MGCCCWKTKNLCKSTPDFCVGREGNLNITTWNDVVLPHTRACSVYCNTQSANINFLMKNLHLGNYITIKVTKPTSCLNFIHLNDISMENHCKENQSYKRSRHKKALCLLKLKACLFSKEARPVYLLQSTQLEKTTKNKNTHTKTAKKQTSKQTKKQAKPNQPKPKKPKKPLNTQRKTP